ncbi:choline kinase, partial [Phenoliferia sp. Uapishka_3]
MSYDSADVLLEIPPARSPLLLPSDKLRHRREDQHQQEEPFFYHENSYRPDDPLDDLEFLAPHTPGWEESDGSQSDDDDDGEDSIEDFSLEDGHIAGVPCANMRMDAKHYQLPDFSAALLELLRDDLRIPGWANLPIDLPPTLVHIHKVSGSLTNAVFFVSIPEETFDISTTGSETPQLCTNRPLQPSDLDHLNGPTTSSSSAPKPRLIQISAPTLLLRIYGPSSGSLISRRTELHILHTLSSAYAIGPRVLGTFTNGRVEEYFHSRALHKEEMRDGRISRWIGRRMRELHRVPMEMLVVPGDENDSGEPSRRSSSRERPSLDVAGRAGGSGTSIYSTSSSSSVFSFGTSTYSTSSAGSGSYSSRSDYGGAPLVSSPGLMRNSESRADSKKRSRSVMSSRSRSRRSKDKLGVWENITRWTREAKLVLKELDQLAALPNFSTFLGPPPLERSSSTLHSEAHKTPLETPSQTFDLRAQLNLPLFEQQVKMYRNFVRDWEKKEGKSKRVFSHNDTQYGNLLLLTEEEGDEERAAADGLLPHQKIIVVDFEYASANPRGFDIANHFIEWQADYHHPLLSHSLFAHSPYPTVPERTRFLRAYVGCDGGADSPSSSPSAAKEAEEDPRVTRLSEEVTIWEPSSHAMWAVWGIVQAKEDLLFKVEKWKKACLKSQREGVEGGMENMSLVDGGERPRLTRGKSGEVVDENGEVQQEGDEDEPEPVADFDYLSYSLGRIELFRKELKELGIVD